MEPVLVCVAGAMLGLHLSILVMIPITLFAIATAISYILLTGQSFLALGYFVALLVVHQAGYIVGLTGRELYANLLRRVLHSQTKHS